MITATSLSRLRLKPHSSVSVRHRADSFRRSAAGTAMASVGVPSREADPEQGAKAPPGRSPQGRGAQPGRREVMPRHSATRPAHALPPRGPLNGTSQLIVAERACARNRSQPRTPRRSLPKSRGRCRCGRSEKTTAPIMQCAAAPHPLRWALRARLAQRGALHAGRRCFQR